MRFEIVITIMAAACTCTVHVHVQYSELYNLIRGKIINHISLVDRLQ